MGLFKANLNFRGIDRDEIVEIDESDMVNWDRFVEKGWLTRYSVEAGAPAPAVVPLPAPVEPEPVEDPDEADDDEGGA